METGSGWRKAEDRKQKAEGRRQKREGREKEMMV